MKTFIQEIKNKNYGCCPFYENDINVILEKDINLEQIKEFIKYNFSYIYNNGLYFNDVKKYFELKEEIENRSEKLQPGDMLEIWSNNNKIFYKYAHVETATHYDNGLTYCEQPYTPWYSKGSYSASGGAWGQIDLSKCEYVGKEDKLFCTWGMCGAKGNGAFNINAQVNKYKMITDKKYIAYDVCCRKAAIPGDYQFFVNARDKKSLSFSQRAFRTVAGLKRFLKDRNLKIGKKINSYGIVHEIIGDFEETATMDFNEFKELKKQYKNFAYLSNGSYTEAIFDGFNVVYCNTNVKEKAELPYIRE